MNSCPGFTPPKCHFRVSSDITTLREETGAFGERMGERMKGAAKDAFAEPGLDSSNKWISMRDVQCRTSPIGAMGYGSYHGLGF